MLSKYTVVIVRASIILLLSLLLPSCTDFWSSSNKSRFREACKDVSMEWAGSPEVADEYCECVLEKMMQKYPNELDAFSHMDQLATDSSLINCMVEIKKKQR
jgi:hypothetical protein